MPCSRPFSVTVAEKGQNWGYLWSSPPYFLWGTMPDENFPPGYYRLATKFCRALFSSWRHTTPLQYFLQLNHISLFTGSGWKEVLYCLEWLVSISSSLKPTNFRPLVIIYICNLLKQCLQYMENIWFQRYSFMKACLFQVSSRCTLSSFVVQNAYFCNYFSTFPQLLI